MNTTPLFLWKIYYYDGLIVLLYFIKYYYSNIWQILIIPHQISGTGRTVTVIITKYVERCFDAFEKYVPVHKIDPNKYFRSIIFKSLHFKIKNYVRKFILIDNYCSLKMRILWPIWYRYIILCAHSLPKFKFKINHVVRFIYWRKVLTT